MNKIITYDDVDKFFFFGNLEVVRKKELKDFRDYLMKDFRKYLPKNDKERLTSSDLFYSLSNYSVDGNSLVHKVGKGLVYVDGDEFVSYDKVHICNDYVNSILIFTSLLGELNIENYNDIAKLFIQYGIFRYDSFDKIWPICIKDILKDNKLRESKGGHSPDYIALESALDDGVIYYDITDTYSIKDTGFLKSIDKEKINGIVNNSKILIKKR